MLDALRRGAQTWLAKILFALLIVSFGIFWNVSDVFQGAGRGSIAHVGDSEITVTEFQRAYQNQLRSLTLEGGGRLSNEQALALKIDRKTLDRLIAQEALAAQARELKLSLSDAVLAEAVRNDPNFAGPDGKFSRMGFDRLLNQLDLSEQGYFQLRREDEMRRQLIDALHSGIVAPPPMIEQLHDWRQETRVLDYVQVDPLKAAKVPDPDDAKIAETYEANKATFMTPEYRNFALLVLGLDDLKSDVALNDDEIKAAYTDSKDTYDKPERRRLQQIAFKDKAAAEAARKELVEGKKNFLDVAKEQGASEADVNLGMLSKKDMIDGKVADAAFGLARDAISEVVEGRFTTVILRAIEIDAGKESTFEEVKEQVRDKLAKDRARALIQDRFDLIEEGRNAGKTLKEIGEEQKLRFFAVEAADASNRTPDGATALDLPDAGIVLKNVFQTSPGLAHEAIELPGESYAWFDVISVTEPKQKPLDEVKGEVKAFYLERETRRFMDELAGKLVERLKAGEAFAKVAADAGGKIEVSDAIRREMSPPGLTTTAVKQAFALAKGGAGYADTSDGKSRVVFQVQEINVPAAPSKEETEALALDLKRGLEDDYLISYITSLQSRLGVRINETELKRATGADIEQ